MRVTSIAVSGWCAGLAWLALATFSLAEAAGKITFKKVQIDTVFRSEGVAVGDFNGDGKLDIVAGSVYYTAPDWKMHSILEKPAAFDPKSYSNVFGCWAEDINGDGKVDIVEVDFPGKQAWWYENPGKPDVPWKRHMAVPVTNNESPLFVDIDGDGRRELVFGYSPDPSKPDSPDRRLAIAKPGKDPYHPWTIRTISAPAAMGSKKYDHGLGVGSIKGDGHMNIVTTAGWYEPAGDRPNFRSTKMGLSPSEPLWIFHQANLGEACAQMCVYDCDGDGRNDVLTTSAHRYGIWWHQQTPDGWKTQLIDKSISQTHAICLADINGDGLMDFVTGKRWWAHTHGDPGIDEPAMLVWFELTRKDGKPEWIRHVIDDNSGVGTQFEVIDVNGDGLLDIVVSNKKGVFYFQQVRE